MKIKFEIITEAVNVKQILSIVGRHFDGFTAYDAIGYWKGESEKSINITILADEKDISKIRVVVYAIKEYNKQEKILVIKSPVIGELV